MFSRFEWSRRKAEQYNELFAGGSFNPDHFGQIRYLLENFLANKQISIELIATCRQSAFVTHRKEESAIFFDIGHSLILKNIFRRFSQGHDYFGIADIYKQAAALYIQNQDEYYSYLINSVPIDPTLNYYVFDTPALQEYNNSIGFLRQVFTIPYFKNAIDTYILCHELFHYMKHRQMADEEDGRTFREQLFDCAVEDVCYENKSNFEEIANYYGQGNLSQESLAGIRRDLQNRRAYYLQNKTILLEEIECDMFSFQMMAMDFMRHNDSLEMLIQFSSIFLVLLYFFDLHYAMNRRAQLSMQSSICEEKPAAIADINLRKAAITEAMINFILTNKGDQIGSKEKRSRVYEKYNHDKFKLKSAIDGLFLMPVTRIMRNCFQRAEDLRDIRAIPDLGPADYATLFDLDNHLSVFL